MGHRHRSAAATAFLLALALAIPPAAAAGAADGGKLTLSLKLEKGQVYPLRATVDQQITQTVQGRAQHVKQKIAIGYVMSVDDVDADGNATLGVEYNSVRLSMQAPGGNVEYDSQEPPAQVHPAAAGLTAIIGQRFAMRLSPAGKVLEVKGLEKVVDAVVEKLQLPPGADGAGVKKMINDQFGEETVGEQMGLMFSFYPDAPVAVGESWERTVMLTKGFPMIVESTYTLKGRKGGVADIAVASKVRSNPDAPPVEMGPSRISYDLKGDQTGVLTVDEGSGWNRATQMEQDLGGTMTVQIVGTPQPLSMPVRIKSVSGIEPADAPAKKEASPESQDAAESEGAKRQ